MYARLRSALAQLPLDDLPPCVLNVGCGAYPSAQILRDALPGWTLYGMDIDGDALRRARRPDLHLVQADARHLPLRASFGLVTIRHPDLYRSYTAWAQSMPSLFSNLAPGGLLLITLYAPEEVELIRALNLPPAFALDDLASADLAGHDRYVLAFRCPFTVTANGHS
jgi:SAM-dependent methyltransferase